MKFVLVPLTLLVLCASLLQESYGNPDGAPICVADPNAVSKGMGGSSQDLGYSIVLDGNSSSYTPGQSYNITIRGKSGNLFQGLLISVVDSGDQPVGSWKLNNEKKLQVKSDCSAVTQTSAWASQSSSPVRDVVLTWTADSKNTGNLNVKAIVVGNRRTVWQYMAPVALNSAQGSSSGGAVKSSASFSKHHVSPLALSVFFVMATLFQFSFLF